MNSEQYKADYEHTKGLYAQNGQELDDGKIKRELTAETSWDVLYPTLESAQALTEKKPSLVKRLVNWIDNILDRLRGVYDPEIAKLQKTRDLYRQCLETASKAKAAGETQNRYTGLLTNKEYARLQSNLSDAKYRGYQFAARPNGGKLGDMDNILVYTDSKGNVERVLEVTVPEGEVFTENDIVQTAIEFEQEGIDYEFCEKLLHSMYGETSSYFRTGRVHETVNRQNPGRTGRNARTVGEGNRSELSAEGEASGEEGRSGEVSNRFIDETKLPSNAVLMQMMQEWLLKRNNSDNASAREETAETYPNEDEINAEEEEPLSPVVPTSDTAVVKKHGTHSNNFIAERWPKPSGKAEKSIAS